MKQDQDYIRDIAEMRSMMERSSKFLSLSGISGIMAGIYALAGAFIAYRVFGFNPQQISYGGGGEEVITTIPKVVALGIVLLILALGTAILFSFKKSNERGEKFWNHTSRRLLVNIAIPLFAGGLLILILIVNNLYGLIAPFSLLFYGLALYNAGKFTYTEIRSLGLVEIALGLIGSSFVEYGLICWALGFGMAHIVYGIYMHYRYER